MTVRELIELLATLPPEAQVVMPHYWDADLHQVDAVGSDSISLIKGKAKSAQTFDVTAEDHLVELVQIA